VVQSRIRRDEIFARYGGEEFAIVLPETDLAGAAALAESIREKIAEHSFVFQNDQIWVTISVGVAALEEVDKSSTDLVKRADERLFEAKRAGRNRVF
jgi:diguanylate cyclase (GGDEF)-like protein